MTKVLSLFVVFGLFLATAQTAAAAPFNACDKNPQIVSCYTGLDQNGQPHRHAIVGYQGDFYGKDLVKRNGNSGNFQQWFYGKTPWGETVGIHSLWKVAKNNTCTQGWHFVNDANPVGPNVGWGTHFPEGVDYCVHNNFYHRSK